MAKKKEKPRHWGMNDIMVTAAFRYCLGRQTYITGCCADWLIEQWPNIEENTRKLIQKELEEEFQRDDISRANGDQYKPLGHDCDRNEWEKARFLWSHPEFICEKCRVILERGKAMVSTFTGLPDFPDGAVVTMSSGGTGKLIDCLKCPKCGHIKYK